MSKKADIIKILVLILSVMVVTSFHFFTVPENVELHGLYQHLYYIPIILAGFWYGLTGGLITAISVTACYMFYYQNHPIHEFNLHSEMFFYIIVGTVTGFLSSMERKQKIQFEDTAKRLSSAYNDLESTFEQLRKADKLAAVGELSAGLAHEIGNPLGSIKGAVNVLEEDYDKTDVKYEFIEIIKNEIERLNNLVTEFNRFAKSSSSHFTYVEVDEIIQSVVRLTRNSADQQNVNIEYEVIDPNYSVYVDVEQIKQVLLNIIINGIHAMPGGGKINISADSDKDFIYIYIADQGRGVARNELDRIFEPFFTTKDTGTGLGLSISYQLVNKNGGDIKADINNNGGLTFTVSLPVKKGL